jgi:hypothetical protein
MRYPVRLQLNEIGYSFPPGHRIRIAVSTAYWPILWPPPDPVLVTVYSGGSNFQLPIRSPRPEDRQIRFEPPVTALPLAQTVLRPGKSTRRLERDIASATTCLEVIQDDGASRIDEIGVVVEQTKILRYRISDEDPTSAHAEVLVTLVNRNDTGWNSKVQTRSAVSCSRDAFFIESDLQAFEDDLRIFSRSWTQTVPRRLL